MGCLTRCDRELRFPLMWRQGSQVSMHVAKGSASLLSSHGRGLGPQDALKKDSRCLSWVAAGNLVSPDFFRGLRELPRVPQRSENRFGVGGTSRDSTGFVAMEEGLISSGGRNLRLPLQF